MAGPSGGVPAPEKGLVFWGRVSTVVSNTQSIIGGLAAQENGFFRNWGIYVVRDNGGAGAAPQGEQQRCSAYVSATGLFTYPAFTVPLVVGDEVYLLHPNLALILEAIGPTGMNQGLVYYGRVTAIPGANQFTCPNLAGLGAGKFEGATNPYNAFIFRSAAGFGAAPQGEYQPITGYLNANGTFTHNAFTVAVAVGDEVLILHPSLVGMIAWAGAEAEGTVAGLNLNGGVATSGLAGADVYTIVVAGRAEVMCGLVSMRNCTPAAIITVRMYTLVDGVDEQIYTQNFTQGVDPNGITPINGHFGINQNLRFEMYSNNAADVAVNVPYKMIWRLLE